MHDLAAAIGAGVVVRVFGGIGGSRRRRKRARPERLLARVGQRPPLAAVFDPVGQLHQPAAAQFVQAKVEMLAVEISFARELGGL